MDFVVGEVIETSPVSLSSDEIIEFAKSYDPQKFHTDPEAAKFSPYEGLIASGLQTIAVAFGQFIRLGYIRDSSLGGPGIDKVEWLEPVRPDDELNTEIKEDAVKDVQNNIQKEIRELKEFTEAYEKIKASHTKEIELMKKDSVKQREDMTNEVDNKIFK